MLRQLEPIPPTIGVDPSVGRSKSASTGIVAVNGLDVVWATNLRRRGIDSDGPPENPYQFGQRIVRRINEIMDELGRGAGRGPAGAWTVAVEAVVDAQSHIRGRRSRITPDHVVGVGIVSAIVWTKFGGKLVAPDHHGEAHKLERGGNGVLLDYYPASLCGRRPPEWPADAAHRDDEREAYDIALAVWRDALLNGDR